MPECEIDRLAAAYEQASDDEVLARLADVPPVAEETDPRWASEGYWRSTAG